MGSVLISIDLWKEWVSQRAEDLCIKEKNTRLRLVERAGGKAQIPLFLGEMAYNYLLSSYPMKYFVE